MYRTREKIVVWVVALAAAFLAWLFIHRFWAGPWGHYFGLGVGIAISVCILIGWQKSFPDPDPDL